MNHNEAKQLSDKLVKFQAAAQGLAEELVKLSHGYNQYGKDVPMLMFWWSSRMFDVIIEQSAIASRMVGDALRAIDFEGKE